jgi:hypothetical protein
VNQTLFKFVFKDISLYRNSYYLRDWLKTYSTINPYVLEATPKRPRKKYIFSNENSEGKKYHLVELSLAQGINTVFRGEEF